MTVVHDMRAIFFIARIFGCTSQITVENDIKARRRRDILFIVIAISVYMASLVKLIVYKVDTNILDSISEIFTITRVFLFYFCYFTDICLTTLWNRKIRVVLSHLRNFDRATNFNDLPRRRIVRNLSRAFTFITFTWWTITGYITYRVETSHPLYHAFVYVIIDVAVFTQILIFVGFSFLIEERFRQLCNILTFPAGKLFTSNRLTVPFTLQQIWWLHCSLANATEMFNSVYAVQLLLWISSLSVNAMSRLYVMYVLKPSLLLIIRDMIVVMSCAWSLLLITAVCHNTSRKANRIGEIIFSTSSSASMKRVFLQENLEVAAYFQLRKVHFFTVAGFIRIDLPLLLSIVSGMTTYLVIVC
ncbi:uncharacterized protein LOC116431251 [Nomia melanderi]|uniref:uncharacterized protein LOC116431251 n=1 Tax=Nomia melanderi TaxID=2448451 RepID=UPI0013045BE2|nr:uncharacterized protein LOC116431251 [Nomia melanderi]